MHTGVYICTHTCMPQMFITHEADAEVFETAIANLKKLESTMTHHLSGCITAKKRFDAMLAWGERQWVHESPWSRLLGMVFSHGAPETKSESWSLQPRGFRSKKVGQAWQQPGISWNWTFRRCHLLVDFHIWYKYNTYIQKLLLGCMVGVVLGRVCGFKFGWGLVLHQLSLQFSCSSVTLMLRGC